MLSKQNEMVLNKGDLNSFSHIIKSILQIAIPISIQTTLISGLQLVDNLFLGRLHNAQYVAAAVNAVNNITFIISSIISGFIASIGIYLINSAAKKNLAQQRELFKIKFIWTIILSVFFLLPLSIFIKQTSSLWISGNNELAKGFARDYGSIIMPSLFIGFITLLFSSTFKQTRIIKITVMVSFIAFSLNSVLNYIFMYTLNMGIKGAAIATLISRFAEVFIWIFYLIRKKPSFIPNVKEWFSISYKKVFGIFPKSAAWTINSFLISLGFTIQILFLSRISIESAASLNSAGTFIQLFRSLLEGYAQALPIILIGYLAMHKKNYKVNLDYIKKVSKISFFIGIIVGIIGGAFSPLIFILYPNYSRHLNIQSIIMVLSISIFMPIGLLIDVPVSTLKGLGVSKSLLIGDSIFNWIIVLPIVAMLIFIKRNALDYGWIYSISVSLSIFKLPFLYWTAFKTIREKKEFKFEV